MRVSSFSIYDRCELMVCVCRTSPLIARIQGTQSENKK